MRRSPKLREQGVEANATPRAVRGVVKKAEKQAIRHIDREHAKGRRKAPARVSTSQRETAELEVRVGRKHVNPAQDNIIARRKSVQRDFGVVARALAGGDREDKKLALAVVEFVGRMPPVTSRHAELVESLRRTPALEQQGRQTRNLTREKGGDGEGRSR